MATKRKSKNLIRKTFPRIRITTIKGDRFYQVDARKQGTKGQREHFQTKKEAETRATEIASEFNTNGFEGLALPASLRESAIRCNLVLEGYGKTIDDATDFFRRHLEDLKAKADSATIATLAPLWEIDKKSGKRKKLRALTLRNILETSKTLVKIWGEKRILEITSQDVGKYIDDLEAGERRKYNVRSLISQFFNWCIKEKHTTFNPAEEIEIDVPFKDPAILSVDDSERLMRLVETDYRDLGRYISVCLFAGLRPTEAKLLKLKLIHNDEKEIQVNGPTSKVKESRNVTIEETLAYWLDEFKDEPDTDGYIVRHKNLRTRLEKLRISAGYKLSGENEDAEEWVEDVLRHSYASYWLAKYEERGKLAEKMGTSLKMIKQKYRNIVKNSQVPKFWAIVPAKIQKQRDIKAQEDAEIMESFGDISLDPSTIIESPFEDDFTSLPE